MDFSTTYLRKRLRSPLVVSANPLTESIDNLKMMEDAGAGAIVLYSLFEEQLRHEQHALHHHLTHGTESYAEALTYFPEPVDYHTTSDAYLEHIRKAKEAVSIPIIASLNGSTAGGWTIFAQKIEQAGADGLELNLYSIPADPGWSPEEVEGGYLVTAQIVKSTITIPVAIKLSPFFTNMAHFARQLDQLDIDALVLFNRFYQPDIDLETSSVYPHLILSTSHDLRLPLRWIALLYGHLKANLAATSGIHSAQDALKAIMAGANVTMMASALLKHGITHLAKVEQDMRGWMEQHEYDSIDQMCGSVSQQHCENPSEFERVQYMRALTTYFPRQDS
ncbi:MAG TPA: dihydroorotate dehydrogenase-like protein [Aggregatilineales bacterium]|nr:dihydroorotate dehydrogenase-like protein [Anaerolineales bacterium]HRE48240.1 dihydroorotate dehydrogenase-like protein [Aggregatilineales bacterium]